MEVQLTYKYRLYPNRQQEKRIKETCDCVRYVYNKLLEDCTNHYRQTGKWKRLDRKSLPELPFLANVDPGALDWAQSRLEGAFRHFRYTERTKPDKYRPECLAAAQKDPGYKLMDTDLVSYPRFKKKKTTKESYSTPLDKLDLQGKRIRLPYIGAVKLEYHRPVPEEARILSGTVLKKPDGHYYLLVKFYLTKEPEQKPPETALGVALAPGTLAVRSDGEPVFYRHQTEQLQRRMETAYRTLKRRKVGSKRYEKQREYLASLYEHRANQRRDDLHKAARQIANAADVIYMQQPDVRTQLRSIANPIGRAALLDEAPWTFASFVKYKTKLDGKVFWAAPKDLYVEALCSQCGARQQRIHPNGWTCPRCRARLELYQNTAANLHNFGQQYIRNLNP